MLIRKLIVPCVALFLAGQLAEAKTRAPHHSSASHRFHHARSKRAKIKPGPKAKWGNVNPDRRRHH